MPPKPGNKLHRGTEGRDRCEKFEQAIAAALKAELGPTHRAVKTLMAWTGASERTVKHWLAGTHGPSGRYFIDLARHSDAVLYYFLAAADRRHIVAGIRLLAIRAKLVDLIEAIDAYSGRQLAD